MVVLLRLTFSPTLQSIINGKDMDGIETIIAWMKDVDMCALSIKLQDQSCVIRRPQLQEGYLEVQL